MSDKLRIWDQVEQPPDWALKTIQAGRLKGKTDINPQWRYRAMTELFGPCGDGWWFTVDRQWLEPAENGEVCAFVDVTLYTEDCDKGIPANGGSKFVANEKNGPHVSDEAYKMATTDALSVAMKMLGVAARIYYGAGGTKYSARPGADKKTGTKKQDTKEADENEAVRKAEAAFHAEWGRVMEAIGEDDLDASKALRHHFVKLTTEGSSGFVVMTDSTGGMSSKEIRLLTAMLKKGHEKVAGHCTGDWREAVGLPALGTVACEICNAVLTEAEKSSCAIAKLGGHYCTKHVADGLKKKQEDSDEA